MIRGHGDNEVVAMIAWPVVCVLRAVGAARRHPWPPRRPFRPLRLPSGAGRGQNVTPDVERVNQLAAEQHIPIATVTETLSPASDNFEQWQVAQLEDLMRALRQGTGR